MICKVVGKKCTDCNRQMRKGYLCVSDPLMPHACEIEYNVCQKERVAIFNDGSCVPLNKRVEVF